MSRVAKEQIIGSFMPTGAVLPYAGSSAPEGYLICNGNAVSRSTYASLFSEIGETYGVGDGSTTFNVPDMRARFPIGFNDDGDIGSGDSIRTNKALAAAGGESKHTLTEAELASHNHGGASQGPNTPDTAGNSGTTAYYNTGNTESAGTGATGTVSANHTHTIAHTHSTTTYVKGKQNVTSASKNAWVPSGTDNDGTASFPTSSGGGNSGTISANHTHTGPSHTHTITNRNHAHNLAGHTHGMNSHTHTISSAGSGTAHENLPSYLTLNYIIKT